jgi:hypothetical protein
MVFGVVACSPPSSEQFHWRLDLSSTGGIGGKGDGQVVMTSDGKVVSSRSGGTCEVTLSSDELRAIQQAVGAVAPGNWETDYQPAKTEVCCDRVTWRLEVTLETSDGTKRTAHAEWHEAAMNQLPPDLRALALVAERVLDRSIEKCRGA